MKLYLVRHGQTEDAEKGIGQSKDSKLSILGKEQAEKTAQLLINKGINILRSSPWLRAKQTAEIINLKLELDIVFDDSLRERLPVISLAGKSTDGNEFKSYMEVMEKNFYFPDWKYDLEGETINEAGARVEQLEKRLLGEYREKTVLVVSHFNFLRCLVTRLVVGYDFNNKAVQQLYRSLNFKNAGITTLEYDEKRKIWRLDNFS